MALITCSECGKEISDMAESCPHCGYKNEKTQTVSFDSETIRNEVKTANAKNQKPLKIVIGAIIAIILLAVIVITAINANYEKYAGTYYSSQAEKGIYSNCPRNFYFDDDGSGIYYWKTSKVYFEYKISSGGVVEIKDSIGIFNYTGKFTDSQFILDGDYSSGRSLEYEKDN